MARLSSSAFVDAVTGDLVDRFGALPGVADLFLASGLAGDAFRADLERLQSAVAHGYALLEGASGKDEIERVAGHLDQELIFRGGAVVGHLPSEQRAFAEGRLRELRWVVGLVARSFRSEGLG